MVQTRAYLSFKSESERLTNLVVLFSHAVPVLTRVLVSPSASALVPLKPADNFPHDKAQGPMLLNWAVGYDQDLAHVVVLSVFNYFEAYIRGALEEIYDLQGGQQAFVTLAEKRVTRHWNSAPVALAEAKHKLQAADDKGKADRFRKYSKILVDAGFAFPPDLLAAYGARQLARRMKPKGRDAFRAMEIPDLLSEALLFNISAPEKSMYHDLRDLRNKVAHGSAPALSVHTAIKKTTALRRWATRIDAHIGRHFLVLAKYVR